jgi:hypothetical protein
MGAGVLRIGAKAFFTIPAGAWDGEERLEKTIV